DFLAEVERHEKATVTLKARSRYNGGGVETEDEWSDDDYDLDDGDDAGSTAKSAGAGRSGGSGDGGRSGGGDVAGICSGGGGGGGGGGSGSGGSGNRGAASPSEVADATLLSDPHSSADKVAVLRLEQRIFLKAAFQLLEERERQLMALAASNARDQRLGSCGIGGGSSSGGGGNGGSGGGAGTSLHGGGDGGGGVGGGKTVKVGVIMKAHSRFYGRLERNSWKAKLVELRQGSFLYQDQASPRLGSRSVKDIPLYLGFCTCKVVPQPAPPGGVGSSGVGGIGGNNSGGGSSGKDGGGKDGGRELTAVALAAVIAAAATSTAAAAAAAAQIATPVSTSATATPRNSLGRARRGTGGGGNGGGGGSDAGSTAPPSRHIFEISVIGGARRLWSVHSPEACRAWVTAINGAMVERPVDPDELEAPAMPGVPEGSHLAADMQAYLAVREKLRGAADISEYLLALAGLTVHPEAFLVVPIRWAKQTLPGVERRYTVGVRRGKGELAQLWKDMKRDTVSINGRVLQGGRGPEAIVGALTRCVLAQAAKAPFSAPVAKLSEAQSLLAARDILLACNRTTSAGDTYLVVDNLCRNYDLVCLVPAGHEAEPLQINVYLVEPCVQIGGHG
ncbi:unnamed protein product, partial [Phaeothamnion confervicola]